MADQDPNDDVDNLFAPITELQRREIKMQDKILDEVRAKKMTSIWIAFCVTLILLIKIAEYLS